MRRYPTGLICLFLSALALPATAASITPAQIGVVTTDLPTASASLTLSALGGAIGVSWTPGGATDPGGPHNSNSYLQFGPAALAPFAGQTISNAELTLQATPSLFGPSPDATTPVTVNLYAVNQALDVTTMTYGTQPTNTGTLIGSMIENSSSGAFTFSGATLTSLVQSWINNPGSNDGLALLAAPVAVEDPSGNFIGAWFNGTATGLQPTLSFSTAAASVPKPSSLVLAFSVATSLGGLAWWRRRRQG
jgi:hypothetical protein